MGELIALLASLSFYIALIAAWVTHGAGVWLGVF